MPEITTDSALAVLPFFGPLLIFVCFTTVMMARGLTHHDRRLELLEGRLAARRAIAPKLSPIAFIKRQNESAQP